MTFCDPELGVRRRRARRRGSRGVQVGHGTFHRVVAWRVTRSIRSDIGKRRSREYRLQRTAPVGKNEELSALRSFALSQAMATGGTPSRVARTIRSRSPVSLMSAMARYRSSVSSAAKLRRPEQWPHAVKSPAGDYCHALVWRCLQITGLPTLPTIAVERTEPRRQMPHANDWDRNGTDHFPRRLGRRVDKLAGGRSHGADNPASGWELERIAWSAPGWLGDHAALSTLPSAMPSRPRHGSEGSDGRVT